MVAAIFYTHQTTGACAGVCACDRTHQMEKTGLTFLTVVLSFVSCGTFVERWLVGVNFWYIKTTLTVNFNAGLQYDTFGVNIKF